MRTSSASHCSWQYKLRRRRTGAIGDHGEECALDAELELAVVEKLADELRQSDPPPQMFQDIDVAVGPSVDHAQRRVVGDELFGRAAFEDAAREAAKPFGGLGVVAASTVMEDANARALFDRVPDVLGNLEMAQHGAVGALLVGLAQVHVYNDARTLHVSQALLPLCMYLSSFSRYLAMTSATP